MDHNLHRAFAASRSPAPSPLHSASREHEHVADSVFDDELVTRDEDAVGVCELADFLFGYVATWTYREVELL